MKAIKIDEITNKFMEVLKVQQPVDNSFIKERASMLGKLIDEVVDEFSQEMRKNREEYINDSVIAGEVEAQLKCVVSSLEVLLAIANDDDQIYELLYTSVVKLYMINDLMNTYMKTLRHSIDLDVYMGWLYVARKFLALVLDMYEENNERIKSSVIAEL